MPAVNILEGTFDDPRIGLCARTLRMSQPAMLVKLARVWSYVTRVGNAILEAAEVALIVGKHLDAVSDALVQHRLATRTDDHELLDLGPMRELYGDYEWYREEQGRATAGGRKRAATAERDSGRFTARDWRTEIPQALAQLGGRAHITDLAEALHCQRKTIRHHLQHAINDGIVIDLSSGMFALPEQVEPVPAPHQRPAPASHQRPAPASHQRPVPAPHQRPAPAPADPEHQRPTSSGTSATSAMPMSTSHSTSRETKAQSQTHAHASSPSAADQSRSPVDCERSSDTKANTGPQTEATADSSTASSRATPSVAERSQALYQAWRQIIADIEAERGTIHVRDPGPMAGPYRANEALSHPELAALSDRQVKHGLALLAEECKAKADAGEEDPWRLLESAWSPRVLRRALDAGTPERARKRAVKHPRANGNTCRGYPTSMPPRQPEDFLDCLDGDLSPLPMKTH